MKKSFLTLLILFVSSNAQAWQLTGLGDFKFEAITKNVYVMHGPLEEPNVVNQGFMNNPAIIVSSNGVIMIDPGSTLGVGEQVLVEMAKITDKPVLAVFNTHIHGDHWLANDAVSRKFPQAKIYAHENMKEQAAEQGLFWIDLMSQLTEGLSAETKVVMPQQGLEQGAEIDIDGQAFRIYSEVPGHTDTDIMIEHVNSKTVFLGDNGVRDRVGRFDDSSGITGNIEALESMLKLDARHFVPGHGKSGSASEAVEPYLLYLKTLHEAVSTGFEEELQGYEIKQKNLEKFQPWQSWRGFEAYFGKHIDKMYLEIEEQAW